jgi:gentisate 1,2-dioxygenase
MNVGVVVAGGTSGNHRHYYESLIYIIEGNGYSVVEGNKVEWEAGDIIYAPPWSWHQHFNTDPDKVVQFLCGTNAPLLQSVGEIDCREEADSKGRYAASSRRLIYPIFNLLYMVIKR